MVREPLTKKRCAQAKRRAATLPSEEYYAVMKTSLRSPAVVGDAVSDGVAASRGKFPAASSHSPRPLPIPAKWSWYHRTLLQLRERLLAAHADHAGQATAPIETAGYDVVDTIQDQLDRDVLWAELGGEDNQLLEIDAALQRLHHGTYGRCEVTGNAIPLARLHAIPWTRFCRSAAEKMERAPVEAPPRRGRIFVSALSESTSGSPSDPMSPSGLA